MANFVFKESKTTSMKIDGFIDTDNMTIDVDDEQKSITKLFSLFNCGAVEINIKVKDEKELDDPTSNE